MASRVSIVICCHNSAERLPNTLAHLLDQDVSSDVPWEVIVVDNASTDQTNEVSRNFWHKENSIPLRVVNEPNLGLSHARYRGFIESRYEVISFIDDDNWVCSKWVQTISDLMSNHPSVGACGGLSQAVCEVPPPWWFEKYKDRYAVGPQGDRSGDVTETRGHLWGAGLTVRKIAWQTLTDRGYRPLLIDRKGKQLSSGSDSELCYALKLSGWRLWYEPKLTFQHYLPSHRLVWSYFRRLHRGFGASSVGFDPYYFSKGLPPAQLKGRSGTIWTWSSRQTLMEILNFREKLVYSYLNLMEGDPDVLEIEYLKGRLLELMSLRGIYDKNIQQVWEAPWNSRGFASEKN